MQKRFIYIIVLILALAAGIFILFASGNPLVKDTVELYRVTLNNESSPNGYFSVEYNRDSDKYPFINIAIDFNKDGSYKTYETEDGMKQQEWVVENMGTRVMEAEGNTFSIRMPDTSIDDRSDFSAVLVMSSSRIEDWDGSVPAGVPSLQFIINKVKQDEIGDLYSPDPEGIRDGGFPYNMLDGMDLAQADNFPEPEPGGSLPAGAERTGAGGDDGADAQEGDGEDEPDSPPNEFHSDVPDIDQGKNECVPTATANSLIWLAEEYDFEERMPESSQSLIGELKKDFKWNEHGVNTKEDYLPGKQSFTERRDIPIETHFVGDPYDRNTLELVAEELGKGQDVELVIEYGTTDNNGDYQRVGGHMVTVVGAWEAEGGQFLGVHDPLSTEIGKLDIYRITGNRIWNYRYRGNARVYSRFIFAESPIEEEEDPMMAPDEEEEADRMPGGDEAPEQADDNMEDPAPEEEQDIPTADSLNDIEEDNLNNTWFLEMLVLDGDYYPLRQFIEADPDQCEGTHYHKRETAYGLHFENLDFSRLNNPQYVRSREFSVVSKRDPNPPACGFGKVTEVPVRTILISRQEATALLGRML